MKKSPKTISEKTMRNRFIMINMLQEKECSITELQTRLNCGKDQLRMYMEGIENPIYEYQGPEGLTFGLLTAAYVNWSKYEI